MATPQTSSELARHYSEHVNFLRGSSAAFDAGMTAEAKRLAVSLRVLLHETGQSHPLLGQLGARNGTFYATPNEHAPGNLLGECHLVKLVLGSTARTLPFLDDFPQWRSWSRIPFARWWNEPIIRINAGTFTRRELVCNVANRDGGAHVDPNLNDAYVALSRTSGLGWTMTADGGASSEPLLGVESACIRQVTHEVLKTLDADFVVLDRDGSMTFSHRPSLHQPCPCGSGKKFRKCHGRSA